MEIDSIDTASIKKFLLKKSANGNLKTNKTLSNNSINLIRTVMYLSMREAESNGIIDCNPVCGVPRCKNAQSAVLAYTVEEQSQIEQAIAASADVRLFGIKICLYTGLRIGELLALEWKDIDFVQGLLFINKSVCFVKDSNDEWKTVVEKPKSAASIRIIPLPNLLKSDLTLMYMASTGKM